MKPSLTIVNRVCSIAIFLAVLLSCNSSEEEIRNLVREEFGKLMQRTIVAPVDVVGPYSPAVRLGGFLFVSGQIAIDQESGALLNENIEIETRQVLDNLMKILKSEHYDSSHVVSATVYLKNMNDYQKMNVIYGGYFQEGNYPARATVEVSNLPRGANVEIAIIAYKSEQE